MKKRIDLLLLEKKLVESRTKAQAMILAGQIYVNDKRINKSGETFSEDSKIVINRLNPEWVSRGALKLSHAIEKYNIKIKNKICLDIGASTGGFTQVLLKNNAERIYSVDVGYNQLHEKLKKEEKIINIEKINARFLDNSIIPELIDILVCDVSFISLKKILEPTIKLLKKTEGAIIVLIKPQFEANKKEIKKGVVIDKLVQLRICDDIRKWIEIKLEMNVIGVLESPIKGPKGNREFLLYATF